MVWKRRVSVVPIEAPLPPPHWKRKPSRRAMYSALFSKSAIFQARERLGAEPVKAEKAPVVCAKPPKVTFADPVLDRLISDAEARNSSLKIAGLRVLEARAQLGIADSGRYPQLQQASALREQFLGSEIKEALYGQEEQAQRYALARQQILSVQGWSEQQRNEELAALVREYPREVVEAAGRNAR